MRYLVALWDGGGIVPPDLAVVRKLVNRGHQVTVLAGPPLQAAVAASGARFRPWQAVPHRHSAQDLDPFADTDLAGPQVVQLLLDKLIVGPAAQYANEVGQALDALEPDVLISDMLLLGAMAMAESRALPCAVLIPHCYLFPCPEMPPFGFGWPPARSFVGRLRITLVNRLARGLWDRGLTAFNQFRSSLKLPALEHVWDQHRAAARVLVLSSGAFDFPAQLPANVRYVGAQLDDPSWVEPATLPQGPEPLVLVGMSSTFMNQAALLGRVVAALDKLGVRGLVATGPEIEPADIPGTEKVKVVRSAAYSAVLPHCSLVVNHGGHGTVIKALAAGLPQLVLPLGRDQPNHAARVAASGVGLVLSPKANAAAIAAALERLLHEPAFKVRAAELGAVVRADSEAHTVVSEIEQLTSPMAANVQFGEPGRAALRNDRSRARHPSSG